MASVDADAAGKSRPPQVAVLVVLLVLGATLRFSGLGSQSFWRDEGLTALLVRMDLGDMLAGIADYEATPPLYHLLAWSWVKVFGTSEAGLRSLSALLGIATVLVAYLVGKELVSRRTGLIAAALTALNPFMFWYSQESRSYGLLILLGALSFLFFVRALRRPARRHLVWWSLTSALALATHYFAVYGVAVEALWLLLARRPRRDAVFATGAVAAAGAGLIPLALAQLGSNNVNWVSQTALVRRIVDVVEDFLACESGAGAGSVIWYAGIASAALALGGLALLVSRVERSERRNARVALSVAGASIALPLALALVGFDYFLSRYLAFAWLPLAVGLAVGFAECRPKYVGVCLALGLCLAGGVIVMAVKSAPDFQREDWRGAAQAIGAPSKLRAVIVSEPYADAEHADRDPPGVPVLDYYLPGSRALPAAGARVAEVAVIHQAASGGSRLAARLQRAGFTPLATKVVQRFITRRFEARAPRLLRPSAIRTGDRGVVVRFLLQPELDLDKGHGVRPSRRPP